MTPITCRADLEALPIWIVFAQVPQPDGKKPKKVPYTPGTNQRARVNEPATWRTYPEAVADAERTGRLPGIALTPEMNLSLIDIDGRADHPLVAELDSCTERSINGGLHIFVRGRPPAGFVAPAGVELYPRDGNRFVLITDDLVDGRDTIHDRTEILARCFPPQPAPAVATSRQLLDADDQTIIERTLRMPKGRQLHAAGDISGYPSGSEADLGLLNTYIAAGATDPDQLDGLYRQSALYPERRDKWERRDYRERTIARALDGHVAPFEGWQRPTIPPEIRVTAPNLQDAASDMPHDECADVRDELARLRAEKAALARQLAERDQQLAAVKDQRDQAQRELGELQLLQSATMTMLRSREMRPGEKVLGLVALFEAEAARKRGTTDPDGWSDAPLARLAEAGGCSTDTAGRHLNTIASTGVVETRTVNRRDTATGEIRKHRQVRLAAVPEHEPAPNLSARIIALSTARPERDPDDQGWGGKRTCPDCGNAGTVTTTTVSCASCGQVLSTTQTTQPPASEETAVPPMPQLAVSKNRGSYVPPMPQLAGSGIEERRERARQDLAGRAETLADPWDDPPEPTPPPTLFPLGDALPGQSHHFSAD
jgi:hypothetical protein